MRKDNNLIDSVKPISLRSTIFVVFRLYIGIYLAFTVLTYVVTRFLHLSLQGMEALTLLVIVVNLFLLAYLSCTWLNERLGRLYLPIALVITTLLPLAGRLVTAQPYLSNDLMQFREIAWQWQLIILLFIPLLLVSWQYRYRTVVGYCLGLAVLDGGVALGIGHPAAVVVVFFRTAIYLLVGLILNRLQNELRRQNHDLVQVNRQLANQGETRELLAISRERNRMARELHDTLAHSLSAVAVQLEAVNALWDSQPQNARAMLEQSLKTTRSGLNDARQAILSLRTLPLADLGLSLALRSLATAQAERCGFTLNLELPDEAENFPPDVELSIYRVAEEGLRNIAQHARASTVRLRLARQDGYGLFEIQDDGSGFTEQPEWRQEHFGLRGMQEWAEAVGGALTIRSTPGQGTIIHMEWQESDDPRTHL